MTGSEVAAIQLIRDYKKKLQKLICIFYMYNSKYFTTVVLSGGVLFSIRHYKEWGNFPICTLGSVHRVYR